MPLLSTSISFFFLNQTFYFSGNFGFPQNQQYFVQPNGGNQPANIQMVLPSGNVNGAYQPSSPIATTSFPPQYKK